LQLNMQRFQKRIARILGGRLEVMAEVLSGGRIQVLKLVLPASNKTLYKTIRLIDLPWNNI